MRLHVTLVHELADLLDREARSPTRLHIPTARRAPAPALIQLAGAILAIWVRYGMPSRRVRRRSPP